MRPRRAPTRHSVAGPGIRRLVIIGALVSFVIRWKIGLQTIAINVNLCRDGLRPRRKLSDCSRRFAVDRPRHSSNVLGF